ncbi:ABC transporter ATP-binding protein [Myxococcota bacterium]|nr:ABC transporter ATP-binding protein [Myxococcota bacterium]MBU1430459.1 ABC transporter ATP-binding protein [Myxococcota bacterium]MBU1898668.1 ABC transporter ATP-binding protein [Myxococcota bacterium]
MMLSFEGVRKRFGATLALDDVSGALEGRTIGLLGPNGSGKTTLMRICLGLLRPDQGRVEMLGINVLKNPVAARAKMGYAAEGPGRIPGLSGLETVAFAGELCGLRRRQALLRAHEVLDLLGLDEARHRPVETYSTGMHQKVKVAMALVHDPVLLLLDEPTSGLDPQSRDELLDLVVHLRAQGGPAVLLSTHLLHDVERTCDACMIMKDGQILFSGPLEALGRRQGLVYEIRAARDAEPLAAALSAAGAIIEPAPLPRAFYAQLPQGADVDLIWRQAAEVGCLVIHLEPRRGQLSDAFLATIGARRAA